MHLPIPITREIVLVGGGHSHALVLRMWGMERLAGARVTVISPGASAAYSGMLPGFVAGHYPRAALDLDLYRLARFAGARIIQDRATGIDPVARVVTLESGRQVEFDVLSVDIGITSAMPDLPGFSDFATPAKPLEFFADRWRAFRKAADGAPRAVSVIGGGVAGVELAMAMAHALQANGAKNAHVRIIEHATALSRLPARSRAALLAACRKQGVEVFEQAQITHIERRAVHLWDGRTLPSDFTVGAAGTRPYDWLTRTGLPLTDGFIDVGPTLQSTAHEAIFAVGDCAHMTHAPRPKAGVFAVRQASVLFDNLRAAATGGAMRQYQPQKDYLKLISLGGKRAMVDRSGLRAQGAWLWRWKDRIDRKFMTRLTDLPAMPVPALPATRAAGVDAVLGDRKPTCGGCGSKVGAQVLADALAQLDDPARADRVRASTDDAGLLGHGDTVQVLSVDQLRPFVDDPRLMAEIAAVHALGDVWAMGAAPEAVLAAITLPPLSADLQRAWLAEIMAGIAVVAAEAGADVLGGHTATGPELSIGLTVTGLTKAPIGLDGARVGDALVLTKPLGTGVVMAADMALRGRGSWTSAALQSMRQPSAIASAALAKVAHAMTDVTGFGLLGHLSNICTASGVGARIDRTAVPTLPGALDLAGAGIASTLAPANRAQAALIAPLGDSAIDALLIDPQTAGGLLAALPRAELAQVLHDLHAAGIRAVEIGEITENPGNPQNPGNPENPGQIALR
ncbi:selenide, water dikinase SelD [Aliiroseovarius sp. PTFE2010]|uniref:selenide, water dikinase SelD n=1 Tax=Aliiroseovarius sp. PTFE2010 TaxID=3417190 RepID=UPI003CF88492